MKWRIHHSEVTASTNLDALKGSHGDVFTADMQTAGRGRLDHKWLSAPGENLIMSAVLSAEGLSPERVATLPIAVGLAVIEGLSKWGQAPDGRGQALDGWGQALVLKWPNDVLWNGRKLAGILCERHGDNVIVGIGVNVNQQKFPPELQKRAVSIRQSGPVPIREDGPVPVPDVRDAVLGALGKVYETWRKRGLAPFMDRLSAVDCLKGTVVSVLQTDDDSAPLTGMCGGISEDGTLLVGSRHVWAGEAHIIPHSPSPVNPQN